MQPDVLVARFDELTDKNLLAAPVLAVEVLSPSGRLIDLNLKRAHYQRMGTPSYWVLDPDVPDLLVLELDADGRYQEVTGWTATRSSRHTGRLRCESCRPSYSDASVLAKRASHRYGRLTPPLPRAYRHFIDGLE
ncbi:MAG: Uma2 family endonuclease [Pseudonocardiaceae bacterium]